MWLARDYEVLTAHDGDSALTLAHTRAPDLALVDVMMPRLSGYGVVWAFNNHPNLRNIPAVFMTAYPDAARALPQGSRLLLKPFRAQELVETVEQCLNGKSGKAAPADKSQRRRMDRVKVDLAALVSSLDGDRQGRIQTISLLGAFVATQNPLPLNDVCRLCFTHRGEAFELRGKVVHRQDQREAAGMGLSFQDLGLERERQLLRALVELNEGA